MKSIVEEIFGSKVFDESVMREKLAKDTYRELEKTIRDGKQLNIKIANAVAHAMKEWALEQGATHYTHWFQPMTGVTAEKHDGFINPDKDGKVIMEFSGKELIKGEPDASSFPNGGLRATFEGINGSGKHNNWSLSTDTGINLLEPGDTPHENAQFLVFLATIIKAVDEHQDLLRLSVATAGNDHRLGANEAPPAIISIFLGDELTAVLKAIEEDKPYDGKEKELMKIGATVLPKFPKDSTDRNRTSPFAFTGNKFEFRMPGSNSSIAGCNIVLNTVIADEIEKFADILEASDDFDTTLHALIKDTIKNHKRIIFNGNGYDDSWVKEAESRGLLNLKTTPDALPYFKTEENIALFERQKVLSKEEVESRYEILMDEYEKQINIEALTMLDIAKKDILPAASKFSKELTDTIANKKAIGIDLTYELETAKKISEYLTEAYQAMMTLENDVKKLHEIDDFEKSAFYVRDFIIQDMAALRKPCDELEVITSNRDWPFPTYGKLLFGIQ